MQEELASIKENAKISYDDDANRVTIFLAELDWLISTVEKQQKEIERLKVVEQAYEALKTAL